MGQHPAGVVPGVLLVASDGSHEHRGMQALGRAYTCAYSQAYDRAYSGVSWRALASDVSRRRPDAGRVCGVSRARDQAGAGSGMLAACMLGSGSGGGDGLGIVCSLSALGSPGAGRSCVRLPVELGVATKVGVCHCGEPETARFGIDAVHARRPVLLSRRWQSSRRPQRRWRRSYSARVMQVCRDGVAVGQWGSRRGSEAADRTV